MRRRRKERASFRVIAAELDDAGYPPPVGLRWYANTVRRLIVRDDS